MNRRRAGQILRTKRGDVAAAKRYAQSLRRAAVEDVQLELLVLADELLAECRPSLMLDTLLDLSDKVEEACDLAALLSACRFDLPWPASYTAFLARWTEFNYE